MSEENKAAEESPAEVKTVAEPAAPAKARPRRTTRARKSAAPAAEPDAATVQAPPVPVEAPAPEAVPQAPAEPVPSPPPAPSHAASEDGASGGAASPRPPQPAPQPVSEGDAPGGNALPDVREPPQSAPQPAQDAVSEGGASGESVPPESQEPPKPEGEAPQNPYLQSRAERLSRWSHNRRNRNRDRRNRFHGDQPWQGEGQGQPAETAGPGFAQEDRPQLPPLKLWELEGLSIEALNEKLEGFFTPEEIAGSYRKHDVINDFVRAYLRRGGTVITNGVIEIMSDGFGFLRSEKASYVACPEDVYVSPNYVRRFNLRTGDFVEGPIRDPRERPERGKEKFLALGRIETVNGVPPAEWRRIIPFENLTPIFPTRRIQLERIDSGLEPTDISMRFVDLFAPIGFGQRGLIVAPPRTGKTVLLQKIANAITANYPDAYLIVLLIDERPEEVTDMERNTEAHVLASTFDEAPERHAQVAEMVIEMAKRKVESGKDVVILLDSITRLARAYNTLAPHSGKILSGGVDANAMFKPKRFLGAARNIEGGGSLTIIATALIETGSRMDEVIFEEFKGTGNMELVLDRQLSDRRIFPAINVTLSGTRKEELIVSPPELNFARSLRNMLNDSATPADSMDNVIKAMKKFKSNADFIMQKLNH